MNVFQKEIYIYVIRVAIVAIAIFLIYSTVDKTVMKNLQIFTIVTKELFNAVYLGLMVTKRVGSNPQENYFPLFSV